jgi:RND superfamily putative drug exporter
MSIQEIKHKLGHDETPVVVLFTPKDQTLWDADDPAYLSAVEAALAPVARNPDVQSAISYPMTRDARLRSRDGRLTYAVVQLKRGQDEGVAAFQRLREQIRSEQLEVQLGGELATYVDIREQLAKDIWHAEVVSFIALAVLLVWVFGSVTAAMLPLAVGGVAILASVALLKLFSQFVDISVYAANVVSMLGLGLAIDYALFIVSRFREELALGQSVEGALDRTLATAGRTVSFSGLTVAASLFCLLLLPQRFFQNMGLAGGISVASAMFTSILLLPALLSLLGPRVNSLGLPWLAQRIAHSREEGGWYRFSQFVMRHAVLILIGSLLLLLFMGQPVRHMQIGPSDSRSLPLAAESRKVQEALDAHFPDARLSPLALSLRVKGAAHSPAGLAALDAYTQRIQALPGVQRVHGLASVDPKLTLVDYELLYAFPDQFPLAGETLAYFGQADYTMLLIDFAYHPGSKEARELVRQIRALPLPAEFLHVHVGGFPAFHLDYLSSLASHVPWTIVAIVGVIFVLLFLMLGSVLLPLKAVLTNLLSMAATFGALVWIFQDGHFANLLDFTPQGSMDGTILVLIFAAAFGLAIDYEVFLLSRVKEMCDHTRDSMRSVATGIQLSGPIITSAALLIGIVLGAFATGQVVFMKAMGIGLLLSVLVDATLVRMLLVPASLRLLGRLNWWAPEWMLKVYRRFNLSDPPHP